VTTPRPTKATVAGDVYLSLRAKARREHRPTDELLQLYVLEGFLDRLISSPHAPRFVLKGGVLLAAYDVRRPTRDIDLLGQRVANDSASLLEVVKDVAAIRLPDGLVFNTDSAAVGTIRDGTADEYSGVRVTLHCSLSTAKVVFHVDVNVGDPIWPAAQNVILPRLLGGQIDLMGYPLPMILAEKIATAIQRGTANTRWRDFADIYLLSGRHPIDGIEMRQSLIKVLGFRKAEPMRLEDTLNGFGSFGQSRWAVWRHKLKTGDGMPADFAEVLTANSKFADPVIEGLVNGMKWNCCIREWTPVVGL